MVSGTLRTRRTPRPVHAQVLDGSAAEIRRSASDRAARQRDRFKLRENGRGHAHARRKFHLRIASVARR
eukprot:1613103-Pleurochrysis_carterae.AAC.1